MARTSSRHFPNCKAQIPLKPHQKKERGESSRTTTPPAPFGIKRRCQAASCPPQAKILKTGHFAKKSRAARGRARHSATAAPNSGRPVGKIARREHGPAPLPFPAKSGHHPGAAVCGQVLILVCGPSLYISDGQRRGHPAVGRGWLVSQIPFSEKWVPPVAFAFAHCFFLVAGRKFCVRHWPHTPANFGCAARLCTSEKLSISHGKRAIACPFLCAAGLATQNFALRRRLEPIEIYNRP